jgi:xylan 1,4-beta-xylosidase
VRAGPDVSAIASFEPAANGWRVRTPNRLSILVWHYHDDDLPGPEANIELALGRLPMDGASARLTQYRIDQTHSNAFTAWQRLGYPAKPTAAQYSELEKAGKLTLFEEPKVVELRDATVKLNITLPRQAVALLVLEWPPTPRPPRQ